MFTPGEPPPRSRDKTLPALPCPSQSIPPRRAAAIRTSWTIDWFCLLLNILVPKSYSIYSLQRPLSHSVFLRCIQAVVHITLSSVAGNHRDLQIHCIVNRLLGADGGTVTCNATVGRFLCASCHGSEHSFLLGVSGMSTRRPSGSRGKYVTRVSRSCPVVF